MPQVRSNLPAEERYTKFAFGIPEVNTQTGDEIVDVYALVGNRDNEPELSGAVITDARQSYNNQGKPVITSYSIHYTKLYESTRWSTIP